MIKRLRIESGLTQRKLAEQVGFSQAHIAKIEQGKVDPRLSTVNKILHILAKDKKMTCKDVMTEGVLFAHPRDKILEISEKMVRRGISQVPIIDRNKIVGTITEESIMGRLGSDVANQTAEEVMVSPLPLVDEETDLDRIRRLLRTHQGVLAVRGKKVTGIVTRSNLLKVICEPI